MNPFKEDLRQVVFLTCAIFSSMAGDSRIPVPTNVEIKMVNETTALLTWDTDNTTTHDVIGFNIFVQCDTRPMYCCGPCEVNETTQDTEFTFSVEGATTYYAMVASRTNQSTSTWSTKVPLRTNPTVPNKPYIEEFPDKKSFTFNLTYGCPYTGPAEYVFGIEGGKQSTAKTLGQDRCSYEFTVDELVPFTEYKYSLLAKNEGCRGTSSQGGITDPHEEEDSKTSYEIKRTTEAYTEDSSSITGEVATESNITITTTDAPSITGDLATESNITITITDAPSITDDLATESNITITTTDAPSITGDVETESNIISITSDEMSEATTSFPSTTRDAPFSSASTEEPPSEGGLTTEFVKPHEICSSRFEGSVKTSPDVPGEPHITSVQMPEYKGQTPGHMILTWRKPNVTNGNVKSYLLDIQGGDHTIQCEIETESLTWPEKTRPWVDECNCRWSQDNGKCKIPLKIDTTYNIQLKARHEGMDEYGPPAVREISTGTGCEYRPPAVRRIITGAGWPDVDGEPYNKLSSSELESYPLYKSYPIQIRKEKFHEPCKSITKCQILLAEGDTQNRDQVDYFDMSGRTSTFQGRIVYSESTLPDRFIFGRDESQCELGEACNAFLEPSKTYQFLFRIFSGSKYTESMTYNFTTKDEEISVWVITGRRAHLPCQLQPQVERDQPTLVLWYTSSDTTPFYGYDVRRGEFTSGVGWADEMVFGTRAYFSSISKPPSLVLEPVHQHDEGLYTCKVHYRMSLSTTTIVNLTVVSACRSNQFKCHSGECIHVLRQCDHMVDCPEGEDEASCPCRPDQFQCISNGLCISSDKRCDRVQNCDDGSDEDLECQIPKAPKMTSSPAGGEKDSYTVTWDTESYTPIVQYRLRYRKSTANLTSPDPGGWDDRHYSPNPTDVISSGHLHHMNHDIDELELATAYEAAVSVENKVGWSDLSEIFYFYTWKG